MTSLSAMTRRLDRAAAAGSQEQTVIAIPPPPSLTSDEADRLRDLLGTSRRAPAETSELDGLLRRAPDVAAALGGALYATVLWLSEREMRL